MGGPGRDGPRGPERVTLGEFRSYNVARPALSRIPTDTIRSELRRRERLIAPLQRRRAVAAAKLAMLDGALAALGAEPGPAATRNGAVRGRPRARNDKTLVETLAGCSTARRCR